MNHMSRHIWGAKALTATRLSSSSRLRASRTSGDQSNPAKEAFTSCRRYWSKVLEFLEHGSGVGKAFFGPSQRTGIGVRLPAWLQSQHIAGDVPGAQRARRFQHQRLVRARECAEHKGGTAPPPEKRL